MSGSTTNECTVNSEIAADIPDRRWWLAAILLLIGLCAAVYLPTLDHEFLAFDDGAYVSKNPGIAEGLTTESIRNAFTEPYVSSWHPLAIVSHAMDIQLFGLNPAGHHATSVVWHTVNVCLLVLVTQRLFGLPLVSVMVAALFAVHPQHVEPVAWISSRKDLISTFFLLCVILFYLRYTRTGARWTYVAAASALVLGLLAKPMLVTIPFALILLDIWPLERVPNIRALYSSIVEKIPLFIVCIVFSILTYWVQSTGGAVSTTEEFPVQERISNAFYALQNYVIDTVVPAGLSGFYPHTKGELSGLQVAIAVLLSAGITLFAALQLRKRPHLFVGWFWFVGMLMPVIGLIQFGAHGMADRYMYVPHIGLFWAISFAAWRMLPQSIRTRGFAAIGAVVVVVYASIAASYVHVWRNDVTLFRHVLSVTKPHYTPLTNLGLGLLDRGHIREAIHCFVAAREVSHIPPPRATNNLGTAYARLDHFILAKALFEESSGVIQNDKMPEENLERVKIEIEETVQRLAEFKSSRSTDSLTAEELVNVGDWHNALAQYPEAVEHYSRAIAKLDGLPDSGLLVKRGLANARAGLLNAAERDLAQAIAANPDDVATYYDLARVYQGTNSISEIEGIFDRVRRRFPERVEASVYREIMID